ncbi:MAG: VWA domain-containing protein [Akkermansiaceae bacterium]|jgi:hypothetical protein|nr:VWA domain-containing protein [Akkermansiaceae bacterium]
MRREPDPRFYIADAPPAVQYEKLEGLVARQRKQDTIQSLVSAIIVLVMVGAILALIAVLPSFRETETLVAYQPPPPLEDEIPDPRKISTGGRPKPAGSSAAMARTIAAAVEAPVAVPVPDVAEPTATLGMDDDFNMGFGSGEGDGDGGGGGGTSFFGTPRTGRRVVYLVDFSESMKSDADGGGTRLDALKKELARSIGALKENMNFNVIFFSHQAWTIDTPGPNQPDKGWNGLNQPPAVQWYPATDRVKGVFKDKIENGPTGHGTVWYSPLKMAFSMSPPPDIVYLLSDGEPSDLEEALNSVDEMNPNDVPVDTIALESPGSAAQAMRDMAKETGGNFTVVYKGRAYTGASADKLAAQEDE